MGATSLRICAISSCRASFAFQSRSEKKRAKPCRIASRSEPKSRYRPSVVGKEVVRVAPHGGDLDAELRHELRRHQAEQVRAGGGRELRREREGPLGLAGAADGRLLFDHGHREARASQEDRGDEAVVACAEDEDVGVGAGHVGAAKEYDASTMGAWRSERCRREPSDGRGERDADKLTRDRERLADLEPGGDRARPIEVESASQVEPHALALTCLRCDGPNRLDEHAAIDGLRVARSSAPSAAPAAKLVPVGAVAAS